jgi:23S rRNA pseudouridine2605 synthase
MCEAVGLDLLDLQRVAFGPLQLGYLKKGEYRKLSKKEIQDLQDAVKQKIKSNA